PRSRRVRRSRRYGVPLVRAGASECVQAERERLYDVDVGAEVQDRVQEGRYGEVERDAADAAEADDLVPARRDQGTGERARGHGDSGTRTTPRRPADPSARKTPATAVGGEAPASRLIVKCLIA